jgi:hypothetical protein
MQTRRTFLAQTAAAAAVATVSAPFLRAQSKTGSTPLVVGAGAHTYECIHDWLPAPEGLVWGDTHGLAQDSQGFIYVAHTVNASSMRPEAIVVYDAKGKFVRAFGEELRGGAHGLGLRKEGGTEFLYHCDTVRCKVVKTTLTGEVVWSGGYPKEDPAYGAKPIRYVPTNVAFAPNGDFFVGDGYGSNRMLRFSGAGKFLGEVSTPGKGETQLSNPHGQYVDLRGPEPVLVIADRGNRRLQTYTLGGQHLRTIKSDPLLRQPCHFDVRGDLMVCPDLDSQVCLLDKDYHVVAQLGDGIAENGKVGSRRGQSRAEFTPGKFITPHGAIFLNNGDILVAEWLPIGRLTLLRKIT